MSNGMRHRGIALLIMIVLFMIGSLIVTIGIGRTVYHDILRYRELALSKQAFYAAESSIEDVIHRHRSAKTISATEALTVNGASVSTDIATVINQKRITATASAGGRVRTSYAVLQTGTGASFNFGLQSGIGGVELQNSSQVVGNVYSNGNVEGAGGNVIGGDVISAGPTGLVTGVHATGSVYAHDIQSSTIDKDAHYAGVDDPIPGVAVGGAVFTNVPDQDTADFPITDALIDEIKGWAEDGGVIDDSNGCVSGTYTIDADTTIGPVKIACNLTAEKKGSATTITLAGPVWVEGNIDTKSGPTFTVDPSLVNETVALIADDEANRTTGSKVIFDQSGATFNTAAGNSYVLVISQNESAELGDDEVAISAQQNLSGKVLLYTNSGLIELKNSASLKEVTGYKILLKNTAEVTYESGLASILFSGGPGGSYTIESWDEVE